MNDDGRRDLTPAQRRAIHHARERRTEELAPLRRQLSDAIAQVGWRRARPVVEGVLGRPVPSRRLLPWTKVGKRNGARLLAELNHLPRQQRLPLGAPVVTPVERERPEAPLPTTTANLYQPPVGQRMRHRH
jgi:hypothetical protein